MTFAWQNMFVAPDEDPRPDNGCTGELETLTNYLHYQRLTLAMKCSGLTPEQLARRAVPPSSMSLLGLIRHMAWVEQHWFPIRMAGETIERHFHTDDDPDAEFNGAVPDVAVAEQAWALWRAEVEWAERYVAGIPDLGHVGECGLALREVLVHMIEEYARHNGHADLLRECIDGKTGQ